jgi:hypothetical protein
MTRVALYARYSSDNQSAASIEDQFRVCREQAGREGWKIVATYHDAAISGASVILRPGVQALLQDAQRGAFDLVLAEALDRVSRDQADVATLFKHLRFPYRGWHRHPRALPPVRDGLPDLQGRRCLLRFSRQLQDCRDR